MVQLRLAHFSRLASQISNLDRCHIQGISKSYLKESKHFYEATLCLSNKHTLKLHTERTQDRVAIK